MVYVSRLDAEGLTKSLEQLCRGALPPRFDPLKTFAVDPDEGSQFIAAELLFLAEKAQARSYVLIDWVHLPAPQALPNHAGRKDLIKFWNILFDFSKYDREIAMGDVTYYVALPFIRNEEGDLVPGEAQDRQTASAAEAAARRMADTTAGAVAFSRTGDAATGEFADAVVIRSFGEVPSVGDLLGGR